MRRAIDKGVLGLALAVLAQQAGAAIIISEVAPWSSGNSSVAADWFELTNMGTTAVDISGWRMDDNSNSFAAAVALGGITSIDPGESVIFLETASLASVSATFKSVWFGAQPTSVRFGSYSGSGVGLSTGGDAVNIYSGSGVLQAAVIFGASPGGPFPTFDNAAGLSGLISQLSAIGVNGAFAAAGNASEIGSPGAIAAVPEPSTYALLTAGLLGLAAVARKRQR